MRVIGGTSARLVLLLGTLLVGPTTRGVSQVGEAVFPQESVLNAALQDGLATREFSKLHQELTKLLGDPDLQMRNAGVWWYWKKKVHFTVEEREALVSLFLTSDPSPGMRQSLRDEIVDLHWRKSSQRERVALYWDAVKNGSVSIWEGQELQRGAALARAAGEGLDEFRTAIERFSSEIDRAPFREGIKPSAVNLWYLKLRTGARNEDDGIRLQAIRLSAMGDQEFRDLMNEDAAFRHTTMGIVPVACADDASEACRNLAEVSVRQDSYGQRLQARQDMASVNRGQSCPAEEDGWARFLSAGTASARVRMARQVAEESQKTGVK